MDESLPYQQKDYYFYQGQPDNFCVFLTQNISKELNASLILKLKRKFLEK